MRLLLLLLTLPSLIFADCPPGWEYNDSTNRCYYFKAVHDRESFWASAYFCQLIGGHLLAPLNAFENSYVQSKLSGIDFWLGAWNNPHVGLYWLNMDYYNSTIKYFNWNGAPPNNDYVAVINANTGLWRGDSSMDSWYGRVCYMPVPAAPQPLSTCPPSPTAPSSSAACDQGWTYFKATASCYVVKTRNTFPRAESNCQSDEGHLVSIHSHQENEFVLELATAGLDSPTASSQTWIGLYKDNGNWTWTDGTPVDYVSWVKNSQAEFAYCTKMITDYYTGCSGCIESQWMYEDCQSNMRAYVCKKPALV